MSENPKMLCVDDDPAILELLVDALEMKYEVFTAENALDGLAILKDQPEINVVISDHYMEGMNGVDFLKEVQQIRKNSYRFLISGYMDLVDILPKIESGIITRFIKKPWSVNSLYRILDSSIK